ncbi:hypothetical protein EV127DRAFT_414404 [Xylaria flabelliformis]|nr:hypothetical protein EV127DRAFT_414404 [Xylaria flabelliformis]
MITFSCCSPFANAKSISTYGRQVLSLDDSKSLKRFGIQVGKNLLTVKGRELPPPTIVYKDARQLANAKTVPVIEGEWNMNKVRVVKPGKKIERWFWISIDEGYRAHSLIYLLTPALQNLQSQRSIQSCLRAGSRLAQQKLQSQRSIQSCLRAGSGTRDLFHLEDGDSQNVEFPKKMLEETTALATIKNSS